MKRRDLLKNSARQTRGKTAVDKASARTQDHKGQFDTAPEKFVAMIEKA